MTGPGSSEITSQAQTQETERGNRKWDKVPNYHSTPSDIIPPARLHVLEGSEPPPNSATHLGQSVPIHQLVGDILHSNHIE